MSKANRVILLVPKDPFVGTEPGVDTKITQTVNRIASSVTVDMNKVTTTTAPKYARFYLTDAKGNAIDPTGKLIVKYDNEDATPCPKTEKGFYVYPAEGVPLTADMFHTWNGHGADASITGSAQVDFNIGSQLNAGGLVCGTGGVLREIYADLSGYNKIVFTGTVGTTLRVKFNRTNENSEVADGVELTPEIKANGIAEVDLTSYSYVHLNAIKIQNGSNGTITSIRLLKNDNTFNKSNVVVRLASPKAYKLYKVVCLFSSLEPTMENGEISKEPNFNLKYTYSFDYRINTKTKEDYVDWRDGSLTANVLSSNPDTDWETSWEELALGYCVKWYVVNESNQKVGLVNGTARLQDNWAMDPSTGYTINAENEAVWTGKEITADIWDGKNKPTFYVPTGQEYANVNGYKIICEIYANSTGDDNPNARYTFSLRNFLGELKPDDAITRRGGMTMDIKKGVTSLEMELEKVKLPNGTAKYARIWLTTTDGTMIDPTGKLLIEGMTPYVTEGNTDVRFGYYLANNGGISLENIQDTLQLPLGTYDQYQVHVALSTEGPTIVNGEITHEPNYDYVYTLGFTYPVKTKYKTLVITTTNSPSVTPTLISNWYELAGDCGVDKQTLADNLYVHWYLVDGNGNNLSFSRSGNVYQQMTGTNQGYYKDRGFSSNNFNNAGDNTSYQSTFTLTGVNNNNYSNVRLICEVTTKRNQNNQNEPGEIQVKYVYSLMRSQDVQSFAHYEGEAYRYLKEIGYDEQAERDYGYITNVGGTAAPTWNSETNSYNQGTNAVRQNVHTVHYYYYATPGADVRLLLPLQDYATGSYTEPRGYFRWYDYKTDNGSGCLRSYANNTKLQKRYNGTLDKGLFAIKFTENPSENLVGVYFNANQNQFDSESNKEFLIACDVSRYFDGMEGGTYGGAFSTLIHEPTLSIRYLFHIKPASAIATEIFDKVNANRSEGSTSDVGLAAVEEKIISGGRPTILEDEGRTVVSTNDGYGEFALRTQLSSLNQYYIKNSANSTEARVNSLWWYAYYKDDKGNWWRHLVPNKIYRDRDGTPDKTNLYRTQSHQAKYSLKPKQWPDKYGDVTDETEGDFEGTWEIRNGNTWTTTTAVEKPTIDVGYRVQMVGCASTGSGGQNATGPTNIIMPIIWTELEFIDARPLELGKESTVAGRTMAYMNEHYGGDERKPKAELDFNDFSLLGQRKPEHSYQNYATVPLQYPNAQYGFIYPQLYGYCATMRGLAWDNGGFGMAPMHGDYTLLKSMNMKGISMDKDYTGENRQSIYVDWVNKNHEDPLFDVTYEREHGKPASPYTDSDDYGGFLYVDAADEARTIATLEFDAELCAGAKIYYTAYVASMTGHTRPKDLTGGNAGAEYNVNLGDWGVSPQTAPSLRFRVSTTKSGRKDDPNRVPVMTFVTGNIRQEVSYVGGEELKYSLSPFKEAQWYQVYGYTTIPLELNDLLDADAQINGISRHYFVEIDNYCDNTDGADYCVDQISFYATNAKLNVMQSAKRDCDEEGARLNIYVSDNELTSNHIEDEYIYWRICGLDGTPVMDEGLYKLDDTEVLRDKEGVPYGATYVSGTYDPTDLQYEDKFNDSFGYFKMESNNVDEYYFSLANKSFGLTEGFNYYISVFALGEDPKKIEEEDPKSYSKLWGKADDVCSVYSPVFVPKMMYLSISGLDGDSRPSIKVDCPDHKTQEIDFEILLNIPNLDDSGFQSKRGVSFDYYIGTKKDLQDEKYGDEGAKFSLEDAVKIYRNYKGALNKDEIPWDTLTIGLDSRFAEKWPKQYKVLKDSVEAGVLHLACSSTVKLVIDADHATLWAMATAEKYEGNLVCTPLPLMFNVIDELEDPSIMLGFEGVTYRNNPRVVRVGKKQLINMQKATDGYLLHIPVNDFKANKDEEEDPQNPEGGSGSDGNTESPALGITSGFLTLLANGTDDPTITKDVNVATFDGKVIDKTRMYISFNFHGVKDSEGKMIVPDTLFHEGYTYRMFFQVKNNAKLTDPAACKADVEFLMKVVPEYVTWNDGVAEGQTETVTGTNQNLNTNWNNDKNWSRSQKAELHKTIAHNTDNYKNNDEIFSGIREDYKGTPATFVPMKFTYVTIPSGNKAPQLVELKTSTKNVGIIDSTSINYDNAHLATDSIEFDMMVMIDEQTECKHNGVANPEKVYEVEKYYGNTCKQIYFKSEAELVYQQFLTYEKAWVEKTLTANRWYLMSTPLKNTYAGDMYVPSVDGRQTTEAFKPIEFDPATYSRTAYPIYQRSWGTAFGSKVYVAQNSSYDAGLSHGSVVESTMAEWGHTFNDVQVPYTNRTAFAIRAHKKEQTVPALLRLPKEDTSYSYYGYDGDGYSAQGSSVTVRDANAVTGRFITDPTGMTATPAVDAAVTISTGSLQQQDGYILVGNPYVASLDMSKFIDVNSAILDDAYYTYGYDEDDDVYKATTHGVGKYGFIRPLEAFFVKLNENTPSNATATIKFTDAMMVDGNSVDNNTTMPSPVMTMTASNGRGQSSATLSVGEETRSVETLFDSNLEEVPMVYTVADGQAVSIHQLTDLSQPIAFGVACAASDDWVEVTFTDLEQLTSGDVYVVDAVTGEQTKIGDGDRYGVQPNDYGRYFLLAGTTGIGSDKVDVQKGILVRVRGSEVTVSSSEELTQVRALSLGGAPVYQDSSRSTTASFTLSSGVYIIQAENAAGEQQTVKVIIR